MTPLLPMPPVETPSPTRGAAVPAKPVHEAQSQPFSQAYESTEDAADDNASSPPVDGETAEMDLADAETDATAALVEEVKPAPPAAPTAEAHMPREAVTGTQMPEGADVLEAVQVQENDTAKAVGPTRITAQPASQEIPTPTSETTTGPGVDAHVQSTDPKSAQVGQSQSAAPVVSASWREAQPAQAPAAPHSGMAEPAAANAQNVVPAAQAQVQAQDAAMVRPQDAVVPIGDTDAPRPVASAEVKPVSSQSASATAPPVVPLQAQATVPTPATHSNTVDMATPADLPEPEASGTDPRLATDLQVRVTAPIAPPTAWSPIEQSTAQWLVASRARADGAISESAYRALTEASGAGADLELGPITTATQTSVRAGGLEAPMRTETASVVAQQLGAAVSGRGPGQYEVALHPPELGRVRIVMEARDGAMMVTLTADRQETLDLMRRNLEELQTAFEDLGYDSLSFDFGQAEQDERPSGHASTDGGPGLGPAGPEIASAAPSVPRAVGADGHLDIRF